MKNHTHKTRTGSIVKACTIFSFSERGHSDPSKLRSALVGGIQGQWTFSQGFYQPAESICSFQLPSQDIEACESSLTIFGAQCPQQMPICPVSPAGMASGLLLLLVCRAQGSWHHLLKHAASLKLVQTKVNARKHWSAPLGHPQVGQAALGNVSLGGHLG